MENKEHTIPAFLELMVNLLEEKWHHIVIASDSAEKHNAFNNKHISSSEIELTEL